MNTTVPFPVQTRQADLTLKRRDPSATRAPMETAGSDSAIPFDHPGRASLQAAWDKLYRARSMLEAEQAHLRDERIAFQGDLDGLEARERMVVAREERIRQIELQAAKEKEEELEKKESGSALSKITRAPFEIARSVFQPKK